MTPAPAPYALPHRHVLTLPTGPGPGAVRVARETVEKAGGSASGTRRRWARPC